MTTETDLLREAVETLRGMVDANAAKWDMPHDEFCTEYMAWSKNRARAFLAKIDAAKGEVPDDVAKDAHRVHAIGLAVNRAARDLPDGYEIRIEIERDAGTVRLYSPDDEVIDHEWDGETFAGEIESAVVAAILSADTEVKK